MKLIEMKLIEALQIAKEPRADSRPLGVVLATGFTPLHLKAFLAAHLKQRDSDRDVEIETGLFGDLAGTLDCLPTTRADAAAMVIEWGDLDPRLGLRRLGGWQPEAFGDIVRTVRTQAARMGESLERLAVAKVAAVCLPTLPLPPIDLPPRAQAGALELELQGIVSWLAASVARRPNIRVVQSRLLDARSPVDQRLDVRSELHAGFPYTLEHASAVARQLAELIRSVPPKKGLITDLDETLWKGIVGEAGVDGIHWDLDHQAQMHGLYQQFLASLAATGVLLGAASKNDPATVKEAWKREDLLLPSESVFPVEAHWGPKSESVSRILDVWNVAPESVVFVDDSPLEIAEVRQAHPAVECIRFPANDEQGIWELFHRLRDLFGKGQLREEDRIRLSSIRAGTQLHASVQAGSTNGESLLEGLGGLLRFDLAKDPPDSRALELINKTNQFNLNGRRLTAQEWASYLGDPATLLVLAAYEDKYGPLGKIAVLAGRAEGRTFFADHWVMSCRAFSRGIEQQCLDAIFSKLEFEEIAFAFEYTPKNAPLREFLEKTSGVAPEANLRLSKESFRQTWPRQFHRIEVSSPCMTQNVAS